MKLIILSIFLYVPVLNFQSSIYTIQLEMLSGTLVNMSSFQGKKILITAINAASPDIPVLIYLDSLQQSDSGLKIIAVPAVDLGGTGNTEILQALHDSLSLHILFTDQGPVKKNSETSQHTLFKWLTHVSENTHFDTDVDGAGQIFIVSGTGILYSVLQNGVPKSVIIQMLSESFNHE